MSKTKRLFSPKSALPECSQHRKSNLHSSSCSGQISVSFLIHLLSYFVSQPIKNQLVLPSKDSRSPHLLSTGATWSRPTYADLTCHRPCLLLLLSDAEGQTVLPSALTVQLQFPWTCPFLYFIFCLNFNVTSSERLPPSLTFSLSFFLFYISKHLSPHETLMPLS